MMIRMRIRMRLVMTSGDGDGVQHDSGDVNDGGDVATLPDETPKPPLSLSTGHAAASLTSYV